MSCRMDQEEEEMDEKEMDDMDVKTRIRYAVFAGHQDGEMSNFALLSLIIRTYC